MDIDRTVTDETIFNWYWMFYGRDRAMQFWRTVTDAARNPVSVAKRRSGDRSRRFIRGYRAANRKEWAHFAMTWPSLSAACWSSASCRGLACGFGIRLGGGVITLRLPWPPTVNTYWHPNKGPLAGRHLISEDRRSATGPQFMATCCNNCAGSQRSKAELPWPSLPIRQTVGSVTWTTC